jgi:hypothetical protein
MKSPILCTNLFRFDEIETGLSPVG